ncbi:MAG: calcium-binding protein [Pseudomonas sp.]|uniref:beta strand repeat-containing protein n=1 Tax=Pseudomonas sp. TaxID=306 RepID=UPI0027328C93|nr:calcium-binding protein [Pseudomonas sp.]MDP3848257.1 calcium-binding protein [Pseudomonas sp.]
MSIISGSITAGDDVLVYDGADDTVDALDGNDSIDGGAGNDSLTGGLGDDTLIGGLGIDTLIGGEGSDDYVVDNASDVVTEDGTGEFDTDTVHASVNYTLGANLENLVLTGSALDGTGNAQDNVITGNTGNNTLDGGAGNDTLIGGLGNDIYVVDSIDDLVTEDSTEVTELDSVQSSVNYTLGENIEALVLTGANDINATGNVLNNTLDGNGGNNILDGGIGDDTLTGGLGNDTYVVDSASDLVVEASTIVSELDTVQSSVNYTLGANLENLVLLNTAVEGTGNELANTLTGNAVANILDGGAGLDTLIGGAGNDTYVVDTATDTIIETSTLVTELDTVQSSVTYTLGANLEKLVLTGGGDIDGAGNELANTLTGNGGLNTLTGGLGNDTYVIGVGDTVVETSTLLTEVDTVQSAMNYTLGANVEKLVLLEGSALLGTGNALGNTITGNSLGNTLDGGTGSDTLIGGLGNDTYVTDGGDTITETSALTAEIDTVQSSVSYTLGANLESLILTGGGDSNGTGNSLNNVLTGNSAINVLDGAAGNDTLNGTGNDTLIGGLGNDTYVVNVATDVISETGTLVAEIDTVQSAATYTLGANLEKLVLTGSTAINGTGNTLANTLTGNVAANVLNGATGSDILIGGLGNDTYVTDGGDTITETSTLLTEIDTVQSSVVYTLGANLEALELTGSAAINGTGNTLANTLTGNSGANLLNGLTGSDTLIGGLGNDTYVTDGGDTITETSTLLTEIDTVQSSATFTLGGNLENLTLTGSGAISGTGNALANSIVGNSAANSLTGAAGNDTLNGGSGVDTLIGGEGSDTYVVDSTTDVLSELGTGVTDIDTVQSSVTYTLGATLENLLLTGAGAVNGTGNASANSLTGNAGANILNGLAGIDTLIGGLGNDTYIVDNTSDVVTETSTLLTEIDTVQSTATFTLSSNLENLTLTGSGVVNGTGNNLANLITGNAAANVLTGGAGNDTYIVGAGDSVIETSTLTTEIDTVQSSVTFTLGNNIEKLTLTGTSVINGTGNALANTLTGNGAANVLNGLTGSDTLIGGLGNDTYVTDGGDTITEASTSLTEVDTVQSSVTYALGANLEDLTLTGSALINGTGNALANRLDGSLNSSANVLTGGAGNDIYVVAAGDTAVETSTLSTEIDTVQSSVTFALGSNVEKLTLTGGALISGTGNTLANTLTGNAVANTLNGGSGNDTLIGGLGNDIYIVDSVADVVTETSTLLTEVDTVQSSVTFTLGNYVENLTLMGAGVINGTGNAQANTITGNAAANILSGGSGIDTLVGGLGNDTYVVDNIADVVTEASTLVSEIDTVLSSVTYTLGANLEKLVLTGTGAVNATGNGLNNTLAGNLGANILNGGLGNDTMIGGDGNDTYIVNVATDVVSETSTVATQIDTVQAEVSYTLGANLEKLLLTGSAAINGFGNGLNNTLTGNIGANTLNGGAGNDTLIGGAGNDIYVVDSVADVVSEASTLSTEIDTVQSFVSWTLGTNLENLTLSGSVLINGTGNALANTITGGAGANILNGVAGNDTILGGDGNDTLIGGAGTDQLTGGAGVDTFDFNALSEMGLGALRDVVSDFVSGTDKIDLSTLDASTLVAGDQAFTLLALNAALTGAGQLSYNTTTHILSGSIDADAAAEFEIQLLGAGSGTFTGTDFIA